MAANTGLLNLTAPADRVRIEHRKPREIPTTRTHLAFEHPGVTGHAELTPAMHLRGLGHSAPTLIAPEGCGVSSLNGGSLIQGRALFCCHFIYRITPARLAFL